jgi:hypothetical protein
MSHVSVTITGNQDIVRNLWAWVDLKSKQIDEATQGAGLDTEAGAKTRAPVDTGRSRAGYQYQDMGTGHCRVFNPVDYVIYVELGTYKMPARPALFPSFAEASKNLDRELRSILSS